jgi:GMP synthase-like glutamine amidotransferase
MATDHRPSPSPPVRLGLLVIDSFDEPHRSIAGDYPALYAHSFSSTGVEVDPVDVRDAELPDHDDRDGWIIPGSRQSVYDDEPWIRALESWTAEALDRRTPIAGVCFGHQMVGRVMGAPVTKADVGWNIGAIDYEVQAEPDWLALPERYRLLASHQDQVLEVPDGALLLASAERCPVAAYSVDDHVLCVQGHPEFVPDLARSLYRSRVERIGAEPIAEALATLDRPLDNAEVARWLASVVLKRGGP